MRKENRAVKLGIAGCIHAEWLSGSWFGFLKHCFKLFCLFVLYCFKNIFTWRICSVLITSLYEDVVCMARARLSFIILHCFVLCLNVHMQRNASARKGRGKVLLLDLEFLYRVDHWWSKDMLTICTLTGGKSLLAWLCSFENQKG